MAKLTCSVEGCTKDAKIGTADGQYCGEHAHLIKGEA